jgi:hypothetical protein
VAVGRDMEREVHDAGVLPSKFGYTGSPWHDPR